MTGIRPEQAKTVPSIGYSYDQRDNRLTMDRSDSGINRYQYDAISQLTKAELPWGDTQEYTYDPVGNRMELRDRRGIQWYKYDNGDQLLEIESTFNPEGNDMNLVQAKATASDEAPARFKTVFSYDEAGNQVAKTGPGNRKSIYSFDSLNRMVGMDAPGSNPQANTFDTQDRRMGIAGGESEGKTFLRGACGSAILNEVSSKGKITDRYIVLPDGRLVGHVETSGNKVSWYHFDALGSVIATSDGEGKIISTNNYEPFGASISHPKMDGMFGFVGERGVEDNDNCLSGMGCRYYCYNLSRFISRDPILRIERITSTFNMYNYCANNPLRFVDPSGKQYDDIFEFNLANEYADKTIALANEAAFSCIKTVYKWYAKAAEHIAIAGICKGNHLCEAGLTAGLELGVYTYEQITKYKEDPNSINPTIRKLMEQGKPIPR